MDYISSRNLNPRGFGNYVVVARVLYETQNSARGKGTLDSLDEDDLHMVRSSRVIEQQGLPGISEGVNRRASVPYDDQFFAVDGSLHYEVRDHNGAQVGEHIDTLEGLASLIARDGEFPMDGSFVSNFELYAGEPTHNDVDRSDGRETVFVYRAITEPEQNTLSDLVDEKRASTQQSLF